MIVLYIFDLVSVQGHTQQYAYEALCIRGLLEHTV